MKIVVLDGYTLNPGDLSWEDLASLGQLRVFDRTRSEEVISRARDCDILFTNKTPLPAAILRELPKVKYIGVLATGYNVVDVVAARNLGITVTNIPTYGTDSVAQMVFAHLLEITQHVGDHASRVRQGEWQAQEDWSFWKHPLIELANKTIGIIGMGRIGKAVARIALAFDMKVLAYDPQPDLILQNQAFSNVSLQDLLRQSDIITLHCPLTPETEGFINQTTMSMMKDGAILINTSRGQLIVEDDLADALTSGKLFAAGLDVMRQEPPRDIHRLMTLPNCHITPHIAWAPVEARARLMNQAVMNLRAFLNKQPVHVVN